MKIREGTSTNAAELADGEAYARAMSSTAPQTGAKVWILICGIGSAVDMALLNPILMALTTLSNNEVTAVSATVGLMSAGAAYGVGQARAAGRKWRTSRNALLIAWCAMGIAVFLVRSFEAPLINQRQSPSPEVEDVVFAAFILVVYVMTGLKIMHEAEKLNQPIMKAYIRNTRALARVERKLQPLEPALTNAQLRLEEDDGFTTELRNRFQYLIAEYEALRPDLKHMARQFIAAKVGSSDELRAPLKSNSLPEPDIEAEAQPK